MIHGAVIVKRVRIILNLDIFEALNDDLRRKRPQMAKPGEPAFSVARPERRSSHFGLKPAGNRHPNFEPLAGLGIGLNLKVRPYSKHPN